MSIRLKAKYGDTTWLGSKGWYGLFARKTVCCHIWAFYKNAIGFKGALQMSRFTFFYFIRTLLLFLRQCRNSLIISKTKNISIATNIVFSVIMGKMHWIGLLDGH